MEFYEFDNYTPEQIAELYKKCDVVLDDLLTKVNAFDDSLPATYDFISFIDKITEDVAVHAIYVGRFRPKWSIEGLCGVLQNKKLFMIYWSRCMGHDYYPGSFCFPLLCRELIQRNQLDNIRHLLNTWDSVYYVKHYCVENRNYMSNRDVMRLFLSVPQIIPYIEEMRAKIINENYNGESKKMWNEESMSWFGNNINTFIHSREYSS